MSNISYEHFSTLEVHSKHSINFKTLYVDICEDLIAGLLLSQIIYWFGNSKNGSPRAQKTFGNKVCIVKQRSEWWNEIRISPKQYDRAISILKDKEFVNVEIHKSNYFKGETASYIFLNSEKLMNSINEYLNKFIENSHQGGNLELTKGEFQNLPLGNSGIDQRGIPSYIQRLHTETTGKEERGCTGFADAAHTPKVESTLNYQTEEQKPQKNFSNTEQHNIYYPDQNLNNDVINKPIIKTKSNKSKDKNNYGPPNLEKIERRPNIFTTQQEHEKLIAACKEKNINVEDVYDHVSSWKLNNPVMASQRKSDYLMSIGWGISGVREKLIKEQELNMRAERLKNPNKGRANESVKDDIRRENNAKWIKANGDPNDDPNILRFK